MIARLIYVYFPLLQMLLGLILAAYFGDKVGRKSLVSYYVLRTVFIFTAWPLIGKIPPDIQVWTAHAQWMVDGGLFPVREFPTAYHLGFNLLLWGAYGIYNSPYSIMFVFNLFEIIAMPVLYHDLLKIGGELFAKRSIILFVTSPLVWSCALSGQDEPILLFYSALVVLFILRNQPFHFLVTAFLCFSFTKIIAPIYFSAYSLLGRWRNVVLLFAAIISYWLLAVALGVDPFDFRSAVSLDGPVKDLSQAGYVRGSVWYCLRDVPHVVQFAMLILSWGLSGLIFVKALFNGNLSVEERASVSFVVSTLMMLALFAFYRTCYFPYLLPFLPFTFAAVLRLDFPRRIKCASVVFVALWAAAITHKEDGNCCTAWLGGALDVVLYLSYVIFFTLVICGARRYVTMPWVGARCLVGMLRGGKVEL